VEEDDCDEIKLADTGGDRDNDDFRYSDTSYAGAQSINTRHSTDEVINNFISADTRDTEGTEDDSCFRYSDASFQGGMSTNTRNSTNKIVQGAFELGDEQFDVAMDDETEDNSNDESFDVDVRDHRKMTADSEGFSEVSFQPSSSDCDRANFEEDVQLERNTGSIDFDMNGDDISIGTANYTVNTRNSECDDDESKADTSNGMKIKETLFFM
jgi:hypothetical protein